ncbi:pentapeptide repeat-containing protein [Evansella clarkii]|uniref:pentapeptide repeat-containing protein n=1 Tax=Evansella clarkii TaxID=79879 RepID=UPI000997AB8A|nr:pentapeptide repeat-containing protein [Evansella clarkii]
MTRKTKVVRPKIPIALNSASFNSMEDNSIGNVIIEDTEIYGEEIYKLRASQVIFRNVQFTEVSFRGIELTDVIFEKCDLSNADFTEALIHRTEFLHSKLIGFNAADSTLRNVLFSNCMARYGSFGYSDMKNVIFKGCQLNQAEFFEAKFKYLSFLKCDINDVNYTGTSLEEVDLSTCEFERLHVSLDKLTGCTVTAEQAVGFAKALGLKINGETHEEDIT